MMSAVTRFFAALAGRIERHSRSLGERVLLNEDVLDRSDSFALSPPGLRSANRSCAFFKARDGWIAVNLPREDDRAAVHALLETNGSGDAWDMLAQRVGARTRADLVSAAALLGLAVTAVGETQAANDAHDLQAWPRAHAAAARLRVVDFSSLWAGPLAGAVFARMGADVLRLQSIERPDPTERVAPQLDLRLNGAKRRCDISLHTADGRATLLNEVSRAEVLITSARARALEALGLDRARVFERNPSLIWIAITGHGWPSIRIGFGDDCAAAGGLIAWSDDQPRFVGDALADPLTGVAAAAAALQLIAEGHAGFLDAALARTAAIVAAQAHL